MKDGLSLSTVRRIFMVSLSVRRFAAVLFAASVIGAIAASAGCSDQGEGERCDTRADRSGSDDCQAGLSCVPFSDLGGGATVCDGVTTCGVCCPDDRTQATTDVCALSTVLVGADAAAPAISDAGDAAIVVVDSGSDASDANSSDASDAASDAADSGG